MATFTTRELRTIAAILDGLNKARATNQRLGVPTTPDAFTARFPNGFVTVLRWTEGIHSDDPKRQRAIERSARHRDAYQLDLDAPHDLENLVELRDPQPVKRRRGDINVQLSGGPDAVQRAARAAIGDGGRGIH